MKENLPAPETVSARDRIDRAAYELFCRHGIRAVGVDTIVARSGVAKKTLYRHYPSKNHLAVAFLGRHDELWTQAWLKREIDRRARTPRGKLLSFFDVFALWFREPSFEGCPFLQAISEHSDPKHPVRKAAARRLEAIRALTAEWAQAAGVRNADAFSRQWQLLMMGAVTSARAGNSLAASEAKHLGRLLLASHSTGKEHR